MSTNQYLALFIEEAGEHLQTLDQNINRLKAGESLSADMLEQCFRSAHTLKGAAGLMQFSGMEEISRALEAVFRGMKEGRVDIKSDVAEFLFKGLDGLKLCFASAISSGSDSSINISKIIKTLYGILGEGG